MADRRRGDGARSPLGAWKQRLIMEITAFGIVFLPLLLATLGRPDRILMLAVVAAVFDGASVLNITLGSAAFGVQPAFAADLLFIAVVLLRYLANQHFGTEGRVLYAFWPLVPFTLFAVVSAFVLPKLFEGQVFVWPQRVEKGLENAAVPLYFGSGNLTQVVYLLVDLALGVLTAIYVAARPGFARRILQCYLVSAIIVLFIAGWQWSSTWTGVFYPHDFLISNPNWPDNTDQTFGSIYRISGPFSEPSILCFYLAGVIYASFWMILQARVEPLNVAVFLGATVIALMSTSTTGYVVLAIGCLLVLMLSMRSPRASRRLLVVVILTIPALLAAGLVIWRLFPQIAEIGAQVITNTLDKSSSVSYEVRSRQDHDSFALLFDTFGLGAGWGSVRPSSWLAMIVGSTGLWGPGFVAWFILRFRRQLSATPIAGTDSLIAKSLAVSVVGMLIAAAVSKPELNFSIFWINLGASVAAMLTARHDVARAPAPVSAAAALPFPATKQI